MGSRRPDLVGGESWSDFLSLGPRGVGLVLWGDRSGFPFRDRFKEDVSIASEVCKCLSGLQGIVCVNWLWEITCVNKLSFYFRCC